METDLETADAYRAQARRILERAAKLSTGQQDLRVVNVIEPEREDQLPVLVVELAE